VAEVIDDLIAQLETDAPGWDYRVDVERWHAAGRDLARRFYLVIGDVQSALYRYEGALGPNVDRSDVADAIDDLREALTKDPDLTPAHIALGILRQALGQISEARAAYETYLSDSQDPILRQRAQAGLASLSESEAESLERNP
jgi:tetratricopeptide (TPR) repeat protein